MSLGLCLPRHLLVLLLVTALQSFASGSTRYCLEKDDSYHAGPGSYKCVDSLSNRCGLMRLVFKRVTELTCMDQRGRFPSTLSGEYLKKPNLLKLYLWANQIRRVETDAFQRAPQLEYIGLLNNNLSEVGLEYQNLAHLKHLDLSMNQITRINVDAFVGTTNLETIELFANGLKQIGFEFQNLKKLHAVFLPADQIQPGKIDPAAFLNVDVKRMRLALCNGRGNWQGKSLELCSTPRSSEERSTTIEATIEPNCYRGFYESALHVPTINCGTSKCKCHCTAQMLLAQSEGRSSPFKLPQRLPSCSFQDLQLIGYRRERHH